MLDIKRIDQESWGYVDDRRTITIIKHGKRHFGFAIIEGSKTIVCRESNDVSFAGVKSEAIRQWHDAFTISASR